jgi:hypothetical protein
MMRAPGYGMTDRVWMTCRLLACGAVLASLAPGEPVSASRSRVSEYEARDLVVGTYGEDDGRFGLSRDANGDLIGVSTFCVAKDGSLYVVDCVKRRIRLYGSRGEHVEDIENPQGWTVIRIAVWAGRVYVLGSEQAPSQPHYSATGDPRGRLCLDGDGDRGSPKEDRHSRTSVKECPCRPVTVTCTSTIPPGGVRCGSLGGARRF